MPFTKRLLSSPGWIHVKADHCSNRSEDDIIFPRKRTSWFLFNVDPNVPLLQCTGNCGPCLVPGTTFHKLLISWRDDKLEQQEVMRDPIEKGRIPMKIWDILDAHRVTPMKGSAYKHIPESIASEILVNTNKARNPYIAARCSAIHGKSFLQLGPDFKYQNAKGEHVPYKFKDLKYDLDNSYLRPQEHAQNL